MKYKITRFKNLTIALAELKQFICNGQHLQTGKPFKRFGGLRSREILANWLVCVVANFEASAARYTFTSDPLGGDGIIVADTGETYPTEHVLVPKARPGEDVNAEALILGAVAEKRTKGGAAYATGKTLIVFLNAGNDARWFPNRVARHLPAPLYFAAVWVVGLDHIDPTGEYVYGVTSLELRQGKAPSWLVRISKEFEAWEVQPIQ